MKTFKLIIVLLLLVAAASITSCRKEVKAPVTQPVNASSIAGTYKVTAMSIQPNSGGTPQDIFGTIDNCQKQSQQVLNANFSYQLIDACDPTQNATSVWALQGTQNITINGVTGRLVSFDGKNLVLSFENFMGLPGTLTETLTKQ